MTIAKWLRVLYRHLTIPAPRARPARSSQRFALELLEDRLTPAPIFTFAPTPPGGQVNLTYSQQLTVSGGTAPYSNFVVSAGQLPPGITLSITGLLQGLPTTAGVYYFTASVTDSSASPGPYTEGEQMDIVVGPPGFAYNAANKSLTIGSTASSNEFQYSQASTQDLTGVVHTTFTFTLNGMSLSLPDSLLSTANVTVSGPSTAILLTNDLYTGNDGKQHETSDVAALGPGGGQIRATNFLLTLNGFLTAYAYVGRADSGTLTATAGGENIFVTDGSYSYMTGQGQYYEISGAPNVYGYSVNASDQAWHYDTAAADSFVSSGNAFSYMSGSDTGQSFFNVAVGFDVSYGIATHGQSYAYLIDAPGNNVFVGNASYSYLSGSDSAGSAFNVAEGFLLVYGEDVVGHTDYAYDYSPGQNILGGKWILLT